MRRESLPGLGTGFIVRNDGVIVTNAHVIAGADSISVMLRDGTVYPAKRLGTDETNDIAVIKIDAKGLPVAKLGNSADLLVGEWSIAIGNPYGFLLGNSEPSVTAGVISGVGRNLVDRGDGPAQYFDMIQTGRGDQSGQLRRSARQRRRRGHRRQQLDLLDERRLGGSRLRHSDQSRLARRRRSARARIGAPAMGGRAASAGDVAQSAGHDQRRRGHRQRRSRFSGRGRGPAPRRRRHPARDASHSQLVRLGRGAARPARRRRLEDCGEARWPGAQRERDDQGSARRRRDKG